MLNTCKDRKLTPDTRETPIAGARPGPPPEPWASILARLEPGSRPGKTTIVPAEPGYRAAIFSGGGTVRFVPIIAWAAQPFTTDAWWLEDDKEVCRVEVAPVTIFGAVFDVLVVDPAGTWSSPASGLVFSDEAVARRWWLAEHRR